MSAFGGEADINKGTGLCPLLTQSGHSAQNNWSPFVSPRRCRRARGLNNCELAHIGTAKSMRALLC